MNRNCWKSLITVRVTGGARWPRRSQPDSRPPRRAVLKPGRCHPGRDGKRGCALRRGRGSGLGVDIRVYRRPRQALFHGDEYPHPGRAPRYRAVLRAGSSSNPENPSDESFVVESLVEAMVLLAAHGQETCHGPSVLCAITTAVEAQTERNQPGAAAQCRCGIIEYLELTPLKVKSAMTRASACTTLTQMCS